MIKLRALLPYKMIYKSLVVNKKTQCLEVVSLKLGEKEGVKEFVRFFEDEELGCCR